jgi:hypothetical protein
MGRHINPASKRIALVLKNYLLHLKLRRRKGRGDGAGRSRRRRHHGGDGVQLDRDLNLLGEEIRRERGELALGRRDAVWKREPHRRPLAKGEVTRRRSTGRRSVASEVEEVITRRGVGALAESKLEELLS